MMNYHIGHILKWAASFESPFWNDYVSLLSKTALFSMAQFSFENS